MPRTEPCVSCKHLTTARGRISDEPVCRACQAKPPKEKTLTSLTARPRSGRLPQCRICLAGEPLENGICKDRAACEQRQPPLIPTGKLT